MKKRLLIAMSVIALLCSCGSREPVPSKTSSPEGNIIGTVVVTNGDGEGVDFVKENVEASLVCTDSVKSTYTIMLYKVSFSSRMPVNINMTIPNVHIDEENKLTGNDIVPLAGILGEYPKYTIKNLRGEVVYDLRQKPITLRFEMQCGEYPTAYNGSYFELISD